MGTIPELDDFADVVVLTVKSVLAPVLERLATAEQCNKDLQARVVELGGLRDRVTTIEAKAIPIPIATTLEAVAVDLTPLIERVTATEAHLKSIGDVRDRVIAMEAKALVPVSPRVEPVGLTAAEIELSLRTHLEPVTKELAKVSERVAVVEVRSPVPGLAGKDGAQGKDGADGLGFDDLQAVQQDDRSFTIKAIRGDRAKDIGTLRFPVQIQRGVYIDGKSYELGDVVTWGGSQWHCNEETTTKPGDGSKAWTLIVKRGRDGRDGVDAPTIPVVKVGA